MITLDGRMGEGGGQILRTCLSLSLLTGKPFSIINIRSGRSKPGLRPQHLSAVILAQKIGDALVEGAEIGSSRLSFIPQEVQGGNYKFDIGTAGSTSLVVQSVYLPLSFGDRASKLRLTGGTHVPYAPTYDWIKLNWLYHLESIGFDISLELEEAGFYPQGGGSLRVIINPVNQLSGLEITNRGRLKQIRGISAVANLDRKIAERQRNQVITRIGAKFHLNDIRIRQLPSRFKGTSIALVCEFEHTRCCYTALGAIGKPAEKVADEVCEQVEAFLNSEATIDEYLADQLLLPLSLAGTISDITTPRITKHLTTNAQVIRHFLNANIEISGEIGKTGKILINPKNA
jgi:RNA 3'-terminal phosphate cyclase (ATP)